MIKVAYIGVQGNKTGYGNAAENYILALDSVGVEVVPRYIKMTNGAYKPNNRILELEKNDLWDVSTVIQHNLPDNFAYKSGVENIGAFAYETDSFPNVVWRYNLELMDKVMVFCNSQKDAILKTCGKETYEKTFVIPHALDTSIADKEYPKLDLGLPKSTTKFYTISEYNQRKNIPAILSAYYSEFSASDDVVLIIKTFSPNHDGLKGLIENIKKNTNRFINPNAYPKVILINSFLTDDQINSLHQECDIFVTASHAESFCYPAITSTLFGNYVICPDCTSFKDYIRDGIGHKIGGVQTSVLGCENVPQGLYTSDEKWFNINVAELAKEMRYQYTHKYYLKDQHLRTQYAKDNFSFEKIGTELVNHIAKQA